MLNNLNASNTTDTVGISATNSGRNFQNSENGQDLSFGELTEMFRLFQSASFARRKKVLNNFGTAIREERDAEVARFLSNFQGALLDRHINLVVASIRMKYDIAGKPTETDFYRICEGEQITVVNSEDSPAAKKLKVGVYFVDTENDNHFLNFVGDTKRERLRSQFHLLGYHFLHQDNMPYANKVFSEIEAISDARRNEAMLFAIQFLDVKPEVSNISKQNKIKMFQTSKTSTTRTLMRRTNTQPIPAI